MFNVEPKPSFPAPVKVHVPGSGPGSFIVEFRYLDKAARAAFVGALEGKSNLQALSEIVLGWSEVDLPFSLDNLEKLLDKYDTAAEGFFKAFFEELTGAAAKN